MNLSRLVSKKLTVTVATVAGLIASKAYVEAAGVAVAYLTAQGVVDARNTSHILGTLDEVVDAVRDRLTGTCSECSEGHTYYGNCSLSPYAGTVEVG